MQTKGLRIFTIIFALITLGELVCSNTPSYSNLHYFFKPAIVLSLIIYFWSQSKALPSILKNLIVFALLLSVIGDILLMFVDQSPNYFLFGLIAFLTAHIFYVLAFIRQRNKKIKPIGFMIFLVIYASGLFYVMLDGLHEMLIPVAIYMLVILSMATLAYCRKGSVSRWSYFYVLIGAIFFLVSDSILALNKFYQPQVYASISIILTYALAQYFIVIGILSQKR